MNINTFLYKTLTKVYTDSFLEKWELHSSVEEETTQIAFDKTSVKSLCLPIEHCTTLSNIHFIISKDKPHKTQTVCSRVRIS
jgi:hypothetical protein